MAHRVPIDPVVIDVPVYNTATTLTDDEDYPLHEAPPAASGPGAGAGTVPSPAQDFRQRMIKFGIPALLLGTVGNAIVAGLAFRSYKRTGSAVRPALIIGAGGLVISGVSVALLLHGMNTGDDRQTATGMGLWLSK